MSIYYEPDVNLVAQMVNPDGTVCMEDQVFTVGDYNLKFFLADKDGRELNSKLLGKTDFKINYTLNGEKTIEKKSAAGLIPVHLDANDTFALNSIDAVILSDYRLHKSGSELGFLSKGIKGEKGAAGNLKMTLTGAQSSYDPDTMSDQAKYSVTFTYDGEKISGASLNNLKLKCQVQGDTIKATPTQTEEGFEVALAPVGNLADLTPGKYVLNCSGTYSTPEVKDAYTRADAEFAINDVSGKLSAVIEADKSYFVKKDLGNEKLLLRLSLNGKPLTDEQLLNAQVKADTELPVIAKALPGQSAFEIVFDTKKDIDTGTYDLDLKVSNVKDRLNNELTADDSMNVTVAAMARWLKFLLWLLLLAALIALLWYVCTRTALPKKFESVPCKITYLGETDTKHVVDCTVTGGHKQKTVGYDCFIARGISAGVRFKVVPDKKSYWIKPSAKRKALIIPQDLSLIHI